MFAKQGEQLQRMKRTMSVVVKKHLANLGALIQEHGSLETALMAVYTSAQVEGGGDGALAVRDRGVSYAVG